MPRPKGSKNKATVAKLNAQLQAVAAVDPLKKLSDTAVVDMIKERFDVMYRFAQGSTKGAIRSLIISGAPGIGKSHTIEWVLDAYAQQNMDFRYKVLKGAVTAVNLYCLLHEYRKEGRVLVLDDTDSIFFDEQGVALLKAALDSGTRRKISWYSESHALKDAAGNPIDKEFDYEGTMIFITNTDFQSYVDEGKSKLAPHFEALISRSIYLDLKLRGTRAVSLWVRHLVSKNNILVNRLGLTSQQQKTALDFIVENRDKMRTLSIREALKVGGMMKSSPKTWESDARVTLLKQETM